MISCASCKYYSHPECLELPLEIVPMVRTYDWQCNDCKYCYGCQSIENEKKILFCDSCDRGYHTYCNVPPLKRKPKGDWHCIICVSMKEEKEKEDKEKEKEREEEELKEETKKEENIFNADDVAVTCVADAESNNTGKKKKKTKKDKDLSPTIVDTEEEVNASDPETNETTPAKGKRKYTRKVATDKANSSKKGTEAGEEERTKGQMTVGKDVPMETDSVEEKENVEASSTKKVKESDDEVALSMLSNRIARSSSKCLYAKNFSNSNQCPFFGCDGSGSTRNNRSTHASLSTCPRSRDSKKREKELLGVYATGENKDDQVRSSEDMMEEDKGERQEPIDNIVSQNDIDIFEAAKAKALKELRREMAPHPNGLKSIILGNNEIEAWYKSQYPHDCSTLPKLYICEFCLGYHKTETLYGRHMAKCTVRYPPGDEIYRKDNLAVFEVDGEKATAYCQNLCLMSKLFLDHKTLWHDTAPFLFYVMAEYDDKGYHIIGYFSKEKVSFLNYNVSCILVLPHHMKKGYGRLLIDFSYLLTAVEGKTGSPERPLSDQGLMCYRNFWADKLLEYIINYPEKETISIKGISEKMAMQATDVVSTLQYLGMLKYWKGKHVIALRTEVMAEYSSKTKSRNLKDYKEIDEKCLKWKSPSSRVVNTSS